MPGSRFLAALMVLVGAQMLWSQDADQTDPELPAVTDPRASYIVGFSELSAVDLPAEFNYIAASLPRLIVASFDSGSTMTHTYSETELESYGATLIDDQADSALRTLSGTVRQRDALLFEKEVTDERHESAHEAVVQARATLDALLSMESMEPEIEPEKPIEFWSGRATGRLLAPVLIDDDLVPDGDSLDQIARDADLDLLIWGVVEEIRGYLQVDFYAYSPYGAGVDLGRAGTVALPSDIGQESEIIAGEIAAALLGRPWGSLTVGTNVNDAAIFVNGALAGYREASAHYLVPGEVTVLVSANGFLTEERVVSVIDRTTARIDITMTPIVDRVVRVESAPTNADIYVDSVWTGRTPADVSVSDQPLVVRLRNDGYLESRFVLEPDSPDRVARALLPDSLVWADELREKRDGFYRSMTWFVLSVPVTLVLNGVYQSVLSAFPPDAPDPLTPDNWASFGQLGNIFYWASSGALLVNIGLLVNVGINLLDYLEVGEGAHNQ